MAGLSLQRLHQIGLDGVLEQRSHGALSLQVMGRDRLTLMVVAHKDAAQTRLQIHQVGSQGTEQP